MKQPEKTLLRYLKYLEKNYSKTIRHIRAESNVFTCRKKVKQDIAHRLIALKMLFRHMNAFKKYYAGDFKQMESAILPALNDAFQMVSDFHIRFSPDELRTLFNIPLTEWNQYVAEACDAKFTLEEVMMELADEAVAKYAIKAVIHAIRNNSTANRQTRNYLWDKLGIPLFHTPNTPTPALGITNQPTGRRSYSKIERLGCEPLVNELLDKKFPHKEIVDQLAKKGYIVSRSAIARHDMKRRINKQ